MWNYPVHAFIFELEILRTKIQSFSEIPNKHAKNNTQNFGIFGCKTAQDISRAVDISFPDSTQKLSRLGSKYFLNGFKKNARPQSGKFRTRSGRILEAPVLGASGASVMVSDSDLTPVTQSTAGRRGRYSVDTSPSASRCCSRRHGSIAPGGSTCRSSRCRETG